VSELVPTFAAPNFDLVQGFPLYRVGPAHPSGPRWWAKRVVDVVGAAALLLVLSPVLVVAGLGVLLSSRGPILFRQIRVGRDGQLFTMLKFRTYPADHVDEVFALPHGASPFRWARFLRRTSLDELPQLINVIRGEMSLIGPRPERPRFAEAFMAAVPGYEDRLRIAPGMTGLAQVHGLMGDTSIPERVRLDNRYIDSWSLWGDVIILVKTLPAVGRKIGV
jgi:lipopolysaccharide/colanic/teichoic acid biosynthesis glycosyltransferase